MGTDCDCGALFYHCLIWLWCGACMYYHKPTFQDMKIAFKEQNGESYFELSTQQVVYNFVTRATHLDEQLTCSLEYMSL